jgi:hypothetical protein
MVRSHLILRRSCDAGGAALPFQQAKIRPPFKMGDANKNGGMLVRGFDQAAILPTTNTC